MYPWVTVRKLRRLNWSGRRDLNPRPSAWEATALPLSYSRSAIGLYIRFTHREPFSHLPGASIKHSAAAFLFVPLAIPGWSQTHCGIAHLGYEAACRPSLRFKTVK